MLIIFFLISSIILLSTLGYGLIFAKFIGIKSVRDNLGLAGFLGLFLLSIIASYSHLIVSHSYVFNIILIFTGCFIIFNEFIKKNFEIVSLKNLYLVFTALFIALILSKNNEDFPYYHLPNAIQFAQQKLEFGIGNLNHGFKHISSLFMLMSLNYLPKFEYYLFNLTNYLFYVFFIFFSAFEIFKRRQKKLNFANIFLTLLLILFLVKFSRLAEFGSDISGQIVLSIYVFYLIQFIFNKNLNFSDREQALKLLLIFLVFASTLKFISIIYALPLIFLIFKTKKKKEFILKIFQIRFIIFLIFPTLFFVAFNFTSTGCFLYPISKTCFTNFDWSLSLETVNNLNLHYETWAKGGKGPNFQIENPSDYVNSLNWIPNWFSVYFFNKFSDYILVSTFILFFVYFFYFKEISRNKKLKKMKKFSFLSFYIFFILIFVVWFLNFPSLRYAGYLITFLLLSLPFAKFLDSKVNFNSKDSLKKITILIMISYSIFLFKNSNRLFNAFSKSYNEHHNFKNFPFYWVEDVNFKKVIIDNVEVYQTNSKCWNVPAPCIRNVNNLKINSYKGYIFYSIKK